MAAVTFDLSVVTTFPNWSSTAIVAAGVIAEPAMNVVGACLPTNCDAAAGVIVNEELVAAVSTPNRWREACQRGGLQHQVAEAGDTGDGGDFKVPPRLRAFGAGSNRQCNLRCIPCDDIAGGILDLCDDSAAGDSRPPRWRVAWSRQLARPIPPRW